MTIVTAVLSDSAIAEALRRVPGPIFAAAWHGDGASKRLVVHTAAKTGQRELATKIRAGLSSLGLNRVRIVAHNPDKLGKAPSLERLISSFSEGTVAYDPTGAITRARAIVRAGAAVRETLRSELSGLYYAPRQRAFYVALAGDKLFNDKKVKVADLRRIETVVGVAMRDAFLPRVEDAPAVRVGFGLPSTQLVPVDRASVVRGSIFASLRKTAWISAIAAMFGVGTTATAMAEGPAVDEPNLKITGFGGSVDSEGSAGAVAAFTAPLGHEWGVQLEGGFNAADDDTTWGVGGQLFWRDPDSALFGVQASWATVDIDTPFGSVDIDGGRVGGNLELYFDQITLLAAGGVQFGDIQESGYGSVDLRWYMTDNFYASIGGELLEDNSTGRLQIEFQPGFESLPGLAFFARGVIGEDDFDAVYGGITYYFGEPKSLKDRHRRSDPDFILFGLFEQLEAEKQRLGYGY
jgi:hypothetical protein